MAHLPDNILIWEHIKISAPAMLKAGVNPCEVLLWSRNKTLAEVEQALQMVRNQREFDFTKDKGFTLKNKDDNITSTEGKCQSGNKSGGYWSPRLVFYFRIRPFKALTLFTKRSSMSTLRMMIN